MRIAFEERAIDSSILWQAVLADRVTLFVAPHSDVPTQIDVEHRWLISPVSDTDLAALTRADLIRLTGLLASADSPKLILDIL